MLIYDGVLCKVVDENEKGHLELEVVELAPWPNAPEVGSRFWVPGDDKYIHRQD